MMILNSMIDVRPGVTPEQIQRFEQRIGWTLPPRLVEWFTSHNGGKFPYLEIDMPDGSSAGDFDLLGIERAEAYADIEATRQALKGRMPSDTIPFMRDGSGNVFLVDADESVFFWDHDREDVQLIANSIFEFFGKTRTFEPEPDLPSETPEDERQARACISRGNVAGLATLLDRGVDPNLATPDGTTLLMQAAFAGSREAVDLLLSRGAHPARRNVRGQRASTFALLGKRRELAAFLKDREG